MDDRFRGLMLDAARLTRDGRLDEATRVIQRALGGGFAPAAEATARDDVPDGRVTEIDPASRRVIALPAAPSAEATIAPPVARSAGSPADAPVAPPARPAPPMPSFEPTFEPTDADRDARRGDGVADRGRFVAGTHTHGSMSRDYRLFVPPAAAGRALPLVVMLHGCTQGPEDFAAGTGMNEHALRQGFFVLYPEQSGKANPQRCWNWFKHTHQQRDRGEPALLASMTRAVVRRHGIDPRRVYVAGLSAGGAMAAIVAACHPELFAAAGVHSGLAPGAASSLPEALAAMRGGDGAQASGRSRGQRAGGPAGGRAAGERARSLDVPTIVFHGDLDRTVHPRNGERVVEAVTRDASRAARVREERGASDRGRRFTRRVHAGDGTRPDAEHWIVHGGGHGWSGGSPAGSYTDPTGPDATGEMLRFFLEHPLGEPRATGPGARPATRLTTPDANGPTQRR